MEREKDLHRHVENAGAQPSQQSQALAQVQSTLQSQLRTVEYIQLFREFLDACERSNEDLNDPHDVLRDYIQLHEDTAIKEKTVHLASLWSDPNSRSYLLSRMDGEDECMLEHRMDQIIQYFINSLADIHLRPFEEFTVKVREYAALSGAEQRVRVKELLVELEQLTHTFYLADEEDRDFDDPQAPLPRWTFSPNALFSYVPRHLECHVEIAGQQEIYREGGHIQQAVDILRALQYEIQLEEVLQRIDHKNIAEDTKIYGAKTANLREVKRILPSMQNLLTQNGIRINVPDFEGIPADVYKQWKSGSSIDERLQQYYDWYNWTGGRIYVRSSAVFSEDAKNTTGAGIYHSECIEAGLSFEEFMAAVVRVYESVDTDVAMQYRERNGIRKEFMGVTLQEEINEEEISHKTDFENWDKAGRGYVNSSRAYAPELMDVVPEHENKCIFRKDVAMQTMAIGDFRGDYDMYFSQPDMSRRRDTHLMQHQAAFVATLMERAYQKPVQVEFVSDGEVIHLVQTRDLPEAHSTLAPHVEFPEEKPLLTREATGVLNEDMPILPHSKDNKDKHGLVIFLRSYFTSDVSPDDYFPKTGAVLVIAPSREGFGHIETLCIERGLTCIFSSKPHFEEDFSYATGSSQVGGILDRGRMSNVISIGGHTSLRVMANGMEARMYPPREIVVEPEQQV